MYITSRSVPSQMTFSSPGVTSPILITEEGKLVDGFPAVPVVEGAILIKSSKKKENNKTGYEATWLSNKPQSSVAKWYYDNLKANGWEFLQEADPDSLLGDQYFSVMKNGTQVNIIVEPGENNDTEISVEVPLQL